MKFHSIPLFTTLWFLLMSCIKAQQQYSGNSVLNCNNRDETGPSPAFLYACNGEYSSCRAFLIFRALFPYISVPMIATLTSSDQSEMARINNVTRLTVFPEGTKVIVPVNCSCSSSDIDVRTRRYYQATTKYDIRNTNATTDKFFTIANNTYQGLSTCDSLKKTTTTTTNDDEFGLKMEIEVPLRCACPTKDQVAYGINYLLTYTVTWNDDVSSISRSFNVSGKIVADANGFSKEEDATIFPFTTILIPLPSEPVTIFDFAPNNFQNRTFISVLPRPVHVPRSKRKVLVHGGIIAAGSSCLLVVLLLVLFIFRTRLTRICRVEGKGTGDDGYSRDIHVEIARIDRLVRIFKYEELRKATRNFCSKCRIEGCVYRGVLHREEVIAIKKMGTEPAAYNVVNMLSRMNHFNLIKLHGYCEHKGQFLLVFEYMKNGSLRQWLHSKGTTGQGWYQRIQIAIDIANGLLYLHNFAKPAYIHKDINSSNILLDSNLRAKISNFGFARTAAVEEASSNAVTRRVVGTKGYMAPEYIKTGVVTQKIDVYAFGVLLLELITGKDAVVVKEGRDILLSAEIAAMVGENAIDELRKLVEPDLAENGKTEYAFQIISLSLCCLAKNPVNRPSMDDVVSALIKIQRNVQKSDCSV